jgi:hypothetical protein
MDLLVSGSEGHSIKLWDPYREPLSPLNAVCTAYSGIEPIRGHQHKTKIQALA